MMMNRILKILTVILLMALTPAYTYAQSASESYENGLALIKKQDYAGAIACFKASMAINKSAANVKKCNTQISKCQKLMKNSKAKTPAAAPVPEKKLTISTSKLSAPAKPESDYAIQIDSSPEDNGWTAIVEEGVKWVELSKSMDGKVLRLKISPSEKTLVRHASVAVSYGNIIKKVMITQTGKDVELVPNTLFTKFKKKGGQMLINISCNSDTVYANNYNWMIEKAPEWCNAEGTSTSLVLNIAPLEKNDPYYKTGRTGDIILRSQNKECIIRIDQK